MKEVKCVSCERVVYTSADLNECVYCFYEDLEINKVNETEIQDLCIIRLMLTYVKTGQNLLISRGKKFLLGRDNYGKEILIDKHISDLHCSIEVDEHEVTIQDLGSTNGTFYQKYGEEYKIKAEMKIKDNEILLLGKESFMINFIYEKLDQGENRDITDSAELGMIFHCQNCGTEYSKGMQICHGCGSKL